MKKSVLLIMAVIFALGTAIANPVDVNTAKSLGQKFVQSSFENNRNADLNLYYTVTSDRGDACVYVFNVGTTGFVIVAASDNVRPILGYSQNGNFDATNPHNGAMYMLETYKNSITYAMEENIAATPEIAAEWESLKTFGRLPKKNRGKVGPLVQTKWNQNSPYNLFSPQLPANANPAHISAAPGGRCYAGCVATAMGQLMKYWNHPIQGEGQYGYNCVGYGPTYYQYGYQYANFGETTYQWDLMPRSLGNNASQEEIEAVATLLYHCAVATNMTFDWDGSGTTSEIVPGAMASYFDYDYCVRKTRSSYTLDAWISMLKAEFDLGRPVYYSGQSDSGGHAFVADGYDENDLISFNFGWGGSQDNYYAVDAIDYHNGAAAIFNYVPSYVYVNTAQAPTNLVVTKTNDIAQEATVAWTNPIKTMSNQNISAIERIVVTRDGEEIYSVENATPGAAMSFVDDNVPCYSTFEYKVYAVIDGVNGTAATASESFGPTCQWTIVATSSNMGGWKGAALVAYDGAGREIDSYSMPNSTPATYNMHITLGRVSFAWKPVTDNVVLSFKIKDSTGTIVYQYDGNSTEVPEGVLYSGNNGCGSSVVCDAPGEMVAEVVDGVVSLSWGGVDDIGYGYNLYRDGYLFQLLQTNTFVDENASLGGHCYQVCVLCDGGESELTNEVCGTTGEGCDPGTNMWYTLQANGRPIINWEAPETEGLSGYYVYRKENDGEYERVKLVGANKTEYKETKNLTDGTWYYYVIKAYYQDIDCVSSSFKAKYGNEYFVKIYYSTDAVNEFVPGVTLYPNPAKDSFTIEGENLQNVTVFNALGQQVYKQDCQGDNVVINLGQVETGIYMVKVVTANGESIQKVSVIR